MVPGDAGLAVAAGEAAGEATGEAVAAGLDRAPGELGDGDPGKVPGGQRLQVTAQ